MLRMKKLVLLAIACLPSLIFGQSLSKATSIQIAPEPNKAISFSASGATPDTVFYEDFNGSLGNWTTSVQKGPGGFTWNNTSPGGQYTNEPLIFSSSSSNGVMQLRADYLNTPGNASSFKVITAFAKSPAINTIGYPELFLEFEHYFRPFTNTVLTVAVSSDGNTWQEFAVRNGIAANSASANPVIEKIPVGQYIGNQATAYIRFAWKNETHYFWQIDDVRLVTPPAYDLKLEGAFYNTTADSTQVNEFYTRIPLRQANTEEIYIGTKVTNNGYLPQTNVKVNANMAGPQINFNQQSTGVNIQPASVNVPLELNTPFKFFDGQGTYSGSISVSSDSADFTPSDNTDLFSVVVTDTVYARDDNLLTTINNRTPGTILCNAFEIHRQDTATSLSAYIYNSTTNPSAGSTIKMYLFDEDFNVVKQTSDFTISFSGWQNLSIGKTALPPGKYHVGLECILGSVWVGIDNDRVPPRGSSWEASGVTTGTGGADGTWSESSFPSIPFIRLHVVDYNCNPFVTTLNTYTTSTCNGNDGKITVNHQRGTPPFNYVWSALNSGNSISGGQGTDSIFGLNPGNYRLKITDASGCNETHMLNLSNGGAPILRSVEVEEENCYGFNDGSIDVKLSGGTSPFNFAWSDGSSGVGLSKLENIGEGDYTVTVTDGGALGCTYVDTFYVPGPLFPINVTKFVTNESCDSCNNGIMSFFVNGGTHPYQYSFSGVSSVPPGSIELPNQSINFNNLVPGPYNLYITDANGCQYQTTVDIEKFDPTIGINSVAQSSFIDVFPNPTKKQFTLKLNQLHQSIYWELFDLQGKVVKSIIQNQPLVVVDLDEISNGIYFLKGVYQNKPITLKVIKE
jgi:hypothetical protein